MKATRRASLVAAAMVMTFLACGRASAGPVTVAFSYTFGDGSIIAGTVMGDLQANGDLVGNLSGLQASYSGLPGASFEFVGPFQRGAISLSGSKFFELYGFVSDPNTSDVRKNLGFGITAFTGNVGNAVTVGTFSTSAFVIGFPQGGDVVEASTFNRASFSASLLPEPVAAPEPPTLALAGLAGVGLIGLARRRRARAA